YVVYEDTRRAAAGRRLDRTMEALRAEGISATGHVVEADPVAAVRDALHQLEPPVDEIIVSTHPRQKSGWLRRNVVERIKRAAGDLPVEHVVVDLEKDRGEGAANVLVVANETVVGEPLLEKIRERARKGRASFLLISPQSDMSGSPQPTRTRPKRTRARASTRGRSGCSSSSRRRSCSSARSSPHTSSCAWRTGPRGRRRRTSSRSSSPGSTRSSW